MKRKKTQLVLAAGLLMAALAAYLLLSGADSPAEEATVAADSIYALGGFPQRYVIQVEIQNDRDTYIIQNLTDPADPQGEETAEESLYTIQGFSPGELSQSPLKNIMNTAASLEAKKVIEGEPAAFGLEHPSATLTVTYEDGQATMAVGDEAPGNEGTYVGVDGTIYLVASSNLTGVTESRYYFAGRTVTPGNNQSTVIESITLSGEAFPEAYAIEIVPDQDGWLLPSSHRMTAPVQAGVDAAALAALRTVYGLAAVEVVDFQEDPDGTYGFDAPYLVAEVATVFSGDDAADAIAPFTLTVSQPDEAGLAYAMISSRGFVYRIDTASLPFLGFGLFDFMEKTVLSPDISLLSQVEVVADGQTHLFLLEEDGDGDIAVTLGGAEVDEGLFRSFYETLTAARYESPVTDASGGVDEEAGGENPGEENQEQPTGGLLLRVTYRYRDGRDDSVVAFRAGSARRPLVTLDGGDAYSTQSLYVDMVLSDLAVLIGQAEGTMGSMGIIGSADGPTAWLEDGQVASQSEDAITR